MENNKIYVVLTRTKTILSRLIGFIKQDEYTHASISLDGRLKQMYSFGRKHTYNPFIGSFVEESFNEGVFGRQKKLYGLVMEIEVSAEQYNRAEALVNEFTANKNLYRYNYIGLINSLLNRESCNNYRFVCSEFVYYILNESNIVNFNISRNLVTPQDLLKINGRITFKGNLKCFGNFKKESNESDFLQGYQYDSMSCSVECR